MSTAVSTEKKGMPKHVKQIWTALGILALITVIEIALALTMQKGVALNTIFIVLTVVKAIYIVGTFMHLRYERPFLKYLILSPLILVAWFIVAMMVDGEFWNWAREFVMSFKFKGY